MQKSFVFIPDCCDAIELPVTREKIDEWKRWRIACDCPPRAAYHAAAPPPGVGHVIEQAAGATPNSRL